MRVCVYVCVCVCVCAYLYVCVRAYVCIHTHTLVSALEDRRSRCEMHCVVAVGLPKTS